MHKKRNLKKHICFINPSLGVDDFKRVDLLRSYLPLGCLISSLMSEPFLKKFANRRNRGIPINDGSHDFPGFDISLVQLSLKGKKSVYGYLENFFRISGIDPFLICTTATSTQIEEVWEVALAAKKLKPGASRIIGGPHVSVLPVESLQKSEFQVACIGEGVEIITEVALNLSFINRIDKLKDIPGIAYKDKNGKILKNKSSENLLSLDDYPYPSNSLVKFVNDLDDFSKNATDIVYVLGGFGCPFNCIFCAQKAIHNGIIRQRSAENIFNEIKNLYLKGFKKFALVQETFTSDRKRISKLCALLEKNLLNIEWTVESRVDQIDLEQLKEMKKSGLRLIQLGLETGDQKLLNSISKKSKIENAINLIEWLKKLKINTSIYLLVGLPKQDWQSIFRTTLFFIKNIPYNTATMHASTSIAVPYPGTEIFDKNLVKMFNNEKCGERNGENWQIRNPDICVNDDGEFIGNNYTETDVMTSREILESLIYLDDFCYSILHSKFDKTLKMEKRLRFLEYANKLIYMIERRTIRDIIVNAQNNMTLEKKKRSLKELNIIDEGKENHLKDVIRYYEENPQVFRDFLAQISFVNGYNILKNLSVSNRIKWMKFCCILWNSETKNFNKFFFSEKNAISGKILNEYLSEVNNEWLDQKLRNGNNFTDLELDGEENEYLRKIGVNLCIKNKTGILRFKNKMIL